jgi:hypothetical protein
MMTATKAAGEIRRKSVTVSIFGTAKLPIAMKPNNVSHPIVYRNEIFPLRDKERIPVEKRKVKESN